MAEIETEIVQAVRKLCRERLHGHVTVLVQDGQPQYIKTEVSKKLN